jgi:hypothetical protein
MMLEVNPVVVMSKLPNSDKSASFQMIKKDFPKKQKKALERVLHFAKHFSACNSSVSG